MSFEVPTKGQRVNVTTRYKNIVITDPAEWNDNVYEDETVLQPYPWMKDHQFRISAANSDDRQMDRVIDISNVVHLEVLS